MKSNKLKYPLRKIKFTVYGEIRWGTDRVMLECGHMVRSNAIYKARCYHCKKAV